MNPLVCIPLARCKIVKRRSTSETNGETDNLHIQYTRIFIFVQLFYAPIF